VGFAKNRFSVLRAGSAAVETGRTRAKSGSSPELALEPVWWKRGKKEPEITCRSATMQQLVCKPR